MMMMGGNENLVDAANWLEHDEDENEDANEDEESFDGS